METRPFLQRLFKPFRRTKQKLAQPEPKTTHIFPLSPPKHQERLSIRRRPRRIKIPWNPPVTDPRFNHSLRPMHVARAQAKIATVEKLPDSCLPDDATLASLGFEKLD